MLQLLASTKFCLCLQASRILMQPNIPKLQRVSMEIASVSFYIDSFVCYTVVPLTDTVPFPSIVVQSSSCLVADERINLHHAGRRNHRDRFPLHGGKVG